MGNMIAINNKDIRTTSVTSFLCLYYELWTYFTPFEYVNLLWVPKTTEKRKAQYFFSMLCQFLGMDEIVKSTTCQLFFFHHIKKKLSPYWQPEDKFLTGKLPQRRVLFLSYTHHENTCSKLTIETLEQGVQGFY